jgi:selenocysteine-specific elongation factor
MKSIIIGTAGHIDHGKTALVKALTGIDADRLAEEKRRGITIDLGFAHLELPDSSGETTRFGFIDVPGHEKFVRNMLAGVGGIDMVLLVIAADEGVKPQTREHFDICRLLGIQHGITVITKSDLVDADTLEVVRLEIADFLQGSFLENAPIVAVSSVRGSGLDELKRELARTAGLIQPRSSDALTRLPIDRVFTMKGFGTVVTGTLISGSIRKEDELELFPAHRKLRIRGVQVHGTSASAATAGERTALNLAGIERERLERGMVLASPALLRSTSELDVKISLLRSPRPLKSGARVHFHAFSAETIGRVSIYHSKQLDPGAEGFAHLRLASPQLLLPGDRFIIRQFSPVTTIGGGVVLDAFPRKASGSQHSEFLSKLSDPNPVTALKMRIARRADRGLSFEDAIAETGWRKEKINSLVKSESDIVQGAPLLISTADFGSAMRGISAALSRFHQENPLLPGLSSEALKNHAAAGDAVFDFALDSLLRARKIESADGLLRLPGRDVAMKSDETQARSVIENAFASAGLKVPALKDVIADLKIDKARAEKIITLLLRDKTLIKISDDLVFHRKALDQLRSQVTAQKSRSPQLDVARFKDLTGVSRKYAIPLLEYLDRERVTKRVGDSRVIL